MKQEVVAPKDVKPPSPLHPFNFDVYFYEDPLDSDGPGTSEVPMCGGAFSECTGLEATMEPKVIKEGGRTYGAAQRAGPVTFATVILKRGITSNADLWTWFEKLKQGAFAYRLAAIITMYDTKRDIRVVWRLTNAIPVKFKSGDLNARGTEIAIEELHLVHEGIEMTNRK